MRPAVSAVIPAFNEEFRVGETVRALREAGITDEIIVVDDGSRDRTAAVAAATGARVIRLPSNRGKGEALNRGVALARGGILLFIDADLGATAAEAVRLVDAVRAGGADMAVAVLPRTRHKGGIGLAVGLARFGIWALTGLRLEAPLSGQRAVRRDVFDAVGRCATGFGAEVGLAVDAARAGFRITEVPAGISHRQTGRDVAGFLHRGRQFGAIMRVLTHRTLWRGRRRLGVGPWRSA